MPSDITVQGTVAEGYEGVREELAAFTAEAEHDPGAQLVVHKDGELVVDLWTGDLVTGDSLTPVFSATTGAAYLVAALLVQDGALDLDREVAFYWPEFAAEGKGAVTIRQLLTHRAGLIGADDGFTADELVDDRTVGDRLAAQRPFWQPGAGHGYHVLTMGALVNGVVRRVSGASVQELFEERIRAPYGLDLFLGLPEAERDRTREALPMLPTPEQKAGLAALSRSRSGLITIAFNRSADPDFDVLALANSRQAQEKSPASLGGVGNARGLAGMYAAATGAFAGREPLLKPDTIAEFARPHSLGRDLITGGDEWALGFQALGLRYPSLGADAFGHAGASGTLALADPRAGIAYGFVRRRYAFPGGPAAENDRLTRAVQVAAEGS
ncbi:serine hydrolase [Streptomyces sp. CBMA152]|uniref:serine hydrolase domain-containing protein n=1 Tax=Streptomyces sp. CBMA152 TaxID=1896312 RepID=UPI00166022DB|nr:serine hydrolase domain-containing protein [Streptomyces sp. CBMA152]MBD0747166.1 EstA family serine hydrolase [Streptomyces sp. CBMA152]